MAKHSLHRHPEDEPAPLTIPQSHPPHPKVLAVFCTLGTHFFGWTELAFLADITMKSRHGHVVFTCFVTPTFSTLVVRPLHYYTAVTYMTYMTRVFHVMVTRLETILTCLVQHRCLRV